MRSIPPSTSPLSMVPERSSAFAKIGRLAQHLRRSHHVFIWIAVTLLAVACTKAVWDLTLLVRLNCQEQMFGDVNLFFQAGRGILNGLKPYADLYESKPPGIFVLAALSLWLSGGKSLYWLLFVLFTLATPFITALAAFDMLRTRKPLARSLLLLVSLLFACSVTLYATIRGGIENSEPFAAFFGVLYVLTIASGRRSSYGSMVIASACLFAAIAIREPILLSLAAAALVLAEDNRSLVSSFIVPLVIAIAVGLLVMAIVGYLGPYRSIYFPDMFAARIPTTRSYSLPGEVPLVHGVPNPLWLRGLSFMLVLSDISLGPYALLALVVATLVLARPLFDARPLRLRISILAVTTLLGGMWVLNNAYLYLQLLEILHFQFPWSSGFFRGLTLEYSGIALLWLASYGVLTWFDWRSSAVVARTLVAIYLTTAAVGITGEYTRHMVFAVPFLIAGLLVWLRSAAHGPMNWRRVIVMGVITLSVCVMPFSSGKFNQLYQTQALAMADKNGSADAARAVGERLDKMMDRCGWNRFVDLGGFRSGTMRHSPYQMQYGEVRAFQQPVNNTLHEQFVRDLGRASLVVAIIPDPIHAENATALPSMADPAVRDMITNDFTIVPPICAKAFVPLDKTMSVYFRR